jgi:hypothetical protein
MKKYLFGLGTMLVGAGLMFVFTHTEVSAESEASKPEPFVCSEETSLGMGFIKHCETKTLDCLVVAGSATSCVKRGGFFK